MYVIVAVFALLIGMETAKEIATVTPEDVEIMEKQKNEK